MSVYSKTPRRIMALWFPRLSTDRLQRRDQDRKASTFEASSLVLVAKVDNALRLSAVDRKATALGLTIGQPLANARAMLPELKVVAANDHADLKLLERVADWCDRFTPYVAVDGPRCLLLDVTGVAHLFGGERAMLNRIRATLKVQGFAVRGAVAGTAMAARAFARYRDSAVVAPGEEAKTIAPLPVTALNLDPVTTHALRRAGLKTVGQMASRKRIELVARLGANTLSILDEAMGKTTRPMTPRTPPPDYWQEQNFAEPVFTEDVIRAALNSLAVALSKILERHGQGTRHLEAMFFRSDGVRRRVAIELGLPTRDPIVIERLFREKLQILSDPLDPGFGFDLIRLCAHRIEGLDASINTFEGAVCDEREIRFLVDRLATRFGSHRMLAFQPHDTHIPEEAWVCVPAQLAKPSALGWRKTRKTKKPPRRPLRLFAPPEPIEIGHTPLRLRWRKAWHAITQWEGSERIAMEWWRQETSQVARDYYRAEDETGRRYWLYCELSAPPKWFLHGAFA